ncbi:MAG: hypothetical protein RQ745_13770, partial [Longimicrobiales bacterium]|nr:hypothetical protein [Longimicrobiales bacterium]
TPGQLLTRLAGTSLAGDEPYFTRYGVGAGICFPTIVIDGVTVRSGSPYRSFGGSYDRTNEFRNLSPRANEISAIEVYRSSAIAPVEWPSSCGLIMIWTKR